MKILLKAKVKHLVDDLKTDQKLKLALCIEINWKKTALAYSKELNFYRPTRPIENELLIAFSKELERLETKNPLKTSILNSLKKRRIIQTAPHLGITESPRMLCINWLGSLAVPARHFYVVGMFSGVPFSNRSRPGRINTQTGALNLFPSTQQDSMVYRSTIPKKLIESLEEIPAQIASYIPKPKEGESYTKLAILVCEAMEKKILKKDNLVFLDINEVVTQYLIQILKNKDHILHKIFFESEIRTEFLSKFKEEIMFYGPRLEGKYEQMENFTMSGNSLKSKSREFPLSDPEVLIKELNEKRLCPALIVSFIVLTFLNEFKCFGSFAQVEYLPTYQEKLSKLSFFKHLKISKIPTSNLTTGVFPQHPDLSPADIILGKKFKPNKETLFGEMLLPIQTILLGGYFTGDIRKK